jgi:hypothetical protein
MLIIVIITIAIAFLLVLLLINAHQHAKGGNSMTVVKFHSFIIAADSKEEATIDKQ